MRVFIRYICIYTDNRYELSEQIIGTDKYKDRMMLLNSQVGTDWHRADIRAALEKRGTNLRTLSIAAGLAADTLRNALVRPWPKGEKIIAQAIGVEPAVIWPSRYSKQ